MFVKTTNGQPDKYPYNVGEFRRDNPQTSFPKRISDEMLAEYGVFPVTIADHPALDEKTQRVERNALPHNEAGAWVVGWTVIDKTAEEISDYDANRASMVRSKRDNLLAATDYLALSDTTLTAEMAAYRQALRDITDHVNFPYLDEVDWPVKP